MIYYIPSFRFMQVGLQILSISVSLDMTAWIGCRTVSFVLSYVIAITIQNGE